MEVLSTREAYGKCLVALGEENPNIVVLDADLSCSTYTCHFARKFPDRFFNMGIAEQALMNTAAGLAAYGKIPFASTFAIFATGRAWEPIRNTIAFPKLNVKIVATHGGITVGPDGASHQSLEDIAIMRVIPHMVVIVPADGIEAMKAVRAVVEYDGPVYIRCARAKMPYVTNEATPFKIGKAVVLREGTDITLVACGIMVREVVSAAELLAKKGISAEVVNASTVKPLDEETIVASARKTGCVVTAEEHSVIGGLGSAVCETLAEHYPVPVSKIGVPDMFGQSGSPEELLEAYHLKDHDIVLAAERLLKSKT